METSNSNIASNDPPSISPGSQALLNSQSPCQSWTTDGYPIVDGKYLDLEDGELKTHSGPLMGGPPSISVYWQNRLATGRSDQFTVISKTVASTRSLDEYIIRIGNLLRSGSCKVDSMNATPYSVYLVVMSKLPREEFRDALNEYKLL